MSRSGDQLQGHQAQAGALRCLGDLAADVAISGRDQADGTSPYARVITTSRSWMMFMLINSRQARPQVACRAGGGR